MRLAKMVLVGAMFCALGLWNTGRADGDRDRPTTLFIVRHAEKVGESSDAPLSDVGRERAQTLAWMLRDVSFDAVYSTDFARTRDTVAATAKANQKKLSFYSPRPGLLKKKIEAQHGGQTLLISGHSNTVPALLAELGTPIKEEVLPGYDALFVVTLNPAHGATMLKLHYPEHR